MSSLDKRLALFHYGAKAAARYRNGDETLYFCPICKKGFPKEAAISGDLSIEHVPSSRTGGRGLLLTCRNCNSTLGHKIDSAVANREELKEFSEIAIGKHKDASASGVLEVYGQRLEASIKSSKGITEIRILTKSNDPKNIEQFKNNMRAISEEGNSDGIEFHLSRRVILDPTLAKIGDLKSAFLLIFALLGYRYAFDNKLDIVRAQLIEPKKDIIGTKFWVDLDENDALKKAIYIVSNPLPFYFVTFHSYGVILPSINDEIDIYNEIVSYWQKGERISINADRVIDWPNKLLMNFDYC